MQACVLNAVRAGRGNIQSRRASFVAYLHTYIHTYGPISLSPLFFILVISCSFVFRSFLVSSFCLLSPSCVCARSASWPALRSFSGSRLVVCPLISEDGKTG